MRYSTAVLYVACVLTALGTIGGCGCLSWRHAAYAVGFGLVSASSAFLGALSVRRAR